jgi:hypothetical protein
VFATDRSKLTMEMAKLDITRDTPDTEYTVIDPGLSSRALARRLCARSARSAPERSQMFSKAMLAR